MTTCRHEYAARLIWIGDRGRGTADYASYDRTYRVQIDGKPVLTGTADAAFRGDRRRHNPEDLFLAAIAGCHMLTYLALCARRGVCVLAYEDDARGILELDTTGGGRFTEVQLRPRVTIGHTLRVDLATRLHAQAHAQCFIAASCRVPIVLQPAVQVATASPVRPRGTPEI